MEFVECPNCEKTYPSGYGVCPFCGAAAPPEGPAEGEPPEKSGEDERPGDG